MSEEKKIIIDEDWKSQVAAERETLASETKPAKEPSPDPAQAMPPASFEMLLTTLATEAMMSLGQLPIPGTQKTEANLPQAKYVIDLLEVLAEKTKGNLSEQEEIVMTDILHQLRMMYVAIQSGSTAQASPAE